MRFWATASLLALLGACASQPQTAAPVTTAEEVSPELSTIVVPVRTSLAPLLPLIESQVPKQFEKLDGYEMDKQNRFGIRYKVQRDDISLSMAGSGLHVSTMVHYALEGCRRTTNPLTGGVSMWPCVSCGFGEPMRDVWIALDSHLDWDQSWRLRSRTQARPVEFAKRCNVTFFDIDVSDWKLAPLLNAQLRGAVAMIDRTTPKLANVRDNAQQIWSAMQTPIEIAPHAWLVFEPVEVSLEPIHGSGLQVESALGLRARTRVVFGNKPAAATTSLPPLRPWSEVESGLRVPVLIEVSYDEVSRLLSSTFAGRKYKVEGGTLGVDSIRVTPANDGRIAIAADIDYRGGGLKKYHGTVFLHGKPSFDATAGRVDITDLQYAIDSKHQNAFTRTLDRLAHEAVRAQLAANANWTVASEIQSTRDEITKGMTRELAHGVVLRGRVDALEPENVRATPTAIVIRAVARGAAEIEVR